MGDLWLWTAGRGEPERLFLDTSTLLEKRKRRLACNLPQVSGGQSCPSEGGWPSFRVQTASVPTASPLRELGREMRSSRGSAHLLACLSLGRLLREAHCGVSCG